MANLYRSGCVGVTHSTSALLPPTCRDSRRLIPQLLCSLIETRSWLVFRLGPSNFLSVAFLWSSRPSNFAIELCAGPPLRILLISDQLTSISSMLLLISVFFRFWSSNRRSWTGDLAIADLAIADLAIADPPTVDLPTVDPPTADLGTSNLRTTTCQPRTPKPTELRST